VTTITDIPATELEATSTSNAQNSSMIWEILSVSALTLWLVTLGLWWYIHHRSKEEKIEQNPVSIKPGQHPIQNSLLKAFGSRTLEEGLIKWEQLHGHDPEIHHAVRAVQRFFYSGDNSIQENEIQDAVKKAVKIIKEASTVSTTHDPWSPRSFTPGLTYIEGKR